MVRNKAIVISAPSGSGKTTIVKRLLSQSNQLSFSISATSRGKRFNEIDTKDYYFFPVNTFKEKIEADEFIEWEEVYEGTFYGTLKSEINRIWDLGKVVVFDVDVIGGVNLKKYFGDKALSIFIKVRDIGELESRLRKRESDSDESIIARVEKASKELAYENQFDKVVVNDVLEECFRETEVIVRNFIKE